MVISIVFSAINPIQDGAGGEGGAKRALLPDVPL